MKVIAVALFALFAGCTWAEDALPPTGSKTDIFKVDGDVQIGFITAGHENNASMTVAYDYRYACGALTPSVALMIANFRKSINDINAKGDKLGGLKFGVNIIDSCKIPTQAVSMATQWAVEKVIRLADPTATKAPPVAVIGAYNSRVSSPVAVSLQQFDVPLVDYASTSLDLSDRRRYPLFARTSPSDTNQAAALAVLASKLGHQCVHLVYSDGLYGELGAQEARRQLRKLGICVASDQLAPAIETAASEATFNAIVANIEKTATAKGVICFCEDTTARGFLRAINNAAAKPTLQILASDFWGVSLDLTGLEAAAENAITVTVTTPAVTYDAATFTTLAADSANMDPWFKEFLEDKFKCSYDGTGSAAKCDPSKFTFSETDLPVNSFAGSMNLAVTSLTNAVDKVFSKLCAGYQNKTTCLDYFHATVTGQDIIDELISDASLYDKNGDGHANYDFNWYSGGKYTVVAGWKSQGGLTTTESFASLPATTSTCECSAAVLPGSCNQQ